jgi:DNA-binding SARP family transcriptional activator
MLWPDEDPIATRDRLRQALAAIRRLLEPDGVPPRSVVIADRSEVRFCSDAIETDIEHFVSSAESALRDNEDSSRLSQLCAAIDIYRGELMPGYYDTWITAERDRLAEVMYDCLTQATDLLEKANRRPEAVEYARLAIRMDPLREEGYAALIRLYAADGRRGQALRKYRELEGIFREQLGVAPSEATRTLALRLQEIRPEFPGTSASLTRPPARASQMEAEGGAVPLESPFYIERSTDSEFHRAIARNDSIVLVKGARQIGKTSLLARGLYRARHRGARVILTDIQKLTESQLESAEALFRTLAESIDDQLGLNTEVGEAWNHSRGWNVNFERFMRREALADADSPIVWGLDEIDRLFGLPYCKSVFGLFRAWHNERSLDPDGPWSRLTLAIAYATEVHLFITDLNQSPFNVGTRLALEDFTPAEVADLNRRYGSPLQTDGDVSRFVKLVGGHPYLVRRGLHALAESSESLEAFLARADREDSVFGDHLHRMVSSLRQDGSLCAAMREVLQGNPCPNPESFYRLQSAGLIAGNSDVEARPRCSLYDAFLKRRLL